MKKLLVSSFALGLLALSAILATPAVSHAQTACPTGYTCTIAPPEPTGCPTGYICTMVPASSTSTTTVSTCYQWTTNLSVGSTGPDVIALQTYLLANGYDLPAISSGRQPKGYFGNTTAAALYRYQLTLGLPGTGVLNPQTRMIMNSSCNVGINSPVVSQIVVSAASAATVSPIGNPTTGQTVYNAAFNFTLTAGNDPIYLGKAGVPQDCPTGFTCVTANGFVNFGSKANTNLISMAAASSTGDTNAYYMLSPGTSRQFSLILNITNPLSGAGTYITQVSSISYGTTPNNLRSNSTSLGLDSLRVVTSFGTPYNPVTPVNPVTPPTPPLPPASPITPTPITSCSTGNCYTAPTQDTAAKRAAVEQLYQTLLCREPEAQGWDYWTSYPATTDAIKQYMMSGVEYQSKQQIVQVFQQVLGRAPSCVVSNNTSELNDWYVKAGGAASGNVNLDVVRNGLGGVGTPVTAAFLSNAATAYGTEVSNPASGTTTQQFTFSFSLTAGYNPIYLSRNESVAINRTQSGSLSIVPVNFSDTDISGDAAAYFYVAPGQTKVFSSVYSGSGLGNGSGSISVTQVNYGTDANNLASHSITGNLNGLRALLFGGLGMSSSPDSNLRAAIWDAVMDYFRSSH